jgi:CheY-like chemotaxis protein
MMNTGTGTSSYQQTKILYIEDNKVNIQLVKRSLGTMGYHLTIAEDGNNGLIKATQLLPQVILLDIDLPSIDGITVLRSLKTNFATKDIPVIMYSTQDDSQIQSLCQQYGADAFLSKPTSHGKLLRTIQMLLPVDIAY